MSGKDNNLKTIGLAVVPLILLGVVVFGFLSGGPTKIFDVELPAVEEVHVMRHSLSEDVIHLDVINSGPDPVTIAQVMVRGAFWKYDMTPKRELKPLDTARVTIPFPWNLGEPIEIILLTSTGVTFDYEIEVASNTPEPTFAVFGRFALLGIYVGVIPVALGICWFPFLRRLSNRGIDFFIYLTIGLLAFLTLDAVFEGIEIANELPGVFHGISLIALGGVGAYLILVGIEMRVKEKNVTNSSVFVAWLIAMGIGLHNLGEGLAIGSAYVLGELGLGAMLVVGFTLHNATEGIAIVTPILKERVDIKRLVGLGLLAGGPTIIGCWIGAFTYSQIWSILFLGIGAGALVQVIITILRHRKSSEILQPVNVGALIAGYLLMYGTGLLVGGS